MARVRNDEGTSHGRDSYDFSLEIHDRVLAYAWMSVEEQIEVHADGVLAAVNGWFQVVVVHDSGKSCAIYVDGKSADYSVQLGEVLLGRSQKGRPIWMGVGTQNNTGKGGRLYYSGAMDDIRIYNRALSAEEVKALYDLEKPKGK